MLDLIRSMFWLDDVISGGHLAVRLGQMTFKIYTVWPTSKISHSMQLCEVVLFSWWERSKQGIFFKEKNKNLQMFSFYFNYFIIFCPLCWQLREKVTFLPVFIEVDYLKSFHRICYIWLLQQRNEKLQQSQYIGNSFRFIYWLTVNLKSTFVVTWTFVFG
jgi:hypothetical protein